MTDPAGWFAAGRAAARLWGDKPTRGQAADGVIIESPDVQIVGWPDLEGQTPQGPPLVLLPGVGGWDLPAARIAAALHAAGRPVAVVVPCAGGKAEVDAWLSEIPHEHVDETSESAAVAAGEVDENVRSLAVIAGAAVEILGLPNAQLCDPSESAHQLAPDQTAVVVAGPASVADEDLKRVSALRAVSGHALLVAAHEDIDPDNPWLSQIDLLLVDTRTGSARWRRPGVAEPEWRTLAEERARSDAMEREELAAEKQRRIDAEVAAAAAADAAAAARRKAAAAAEKLTEQHSPSQGFGDAIASRSASSLAASSQSAGSTRAACSKQSMCQLAAGHDGPCRWSGKVIRGDGSLQMNECPRDEKCTLDFDHAGPCRDARMFKITPDGKMSGAEKAASATAVVATTSCAVFWILPVVLIFIIVVVSVVFSL